MYSIYTIFKNMLPVHILRNIRREYHVVLYIAVYSIINEFRTGIKLKLAEASINNNVKVYLIANYILLLSLKVFDIPIAFLYKQ